MELQLFRQSKSLRRELYCWIFIASHRHAQLVLTMPQSYLVLILCGDRLMKFWSLGLQAGKHEDGFSAFFSTNSGWVDGFTTKFLVCKWMHLRFTRYENLKMGIALHKKYTVGFKTKFWSKYNSTVWQQKRLPGESESVFWVVIFYMFVTCTLILTQSMF